MSSIPIERRTVPSPTPEFACNSAGTLAVLLVAVIGFLTGRPEWLDIALTYGLLNLISTLAVLKFFRHGNLAHDAEEPAP